MADRGITFSAAMVRALLDGRKTQTRRLLPVETTEKGWMHLKGNGGGMVCDEDADMVRLGPDYVRHQPGDRLYVREHWKADAFYDSVAPRDLAGHDDFDGTICYLATAPEESLRDPVWGRHRQAMHMPRWASRLTLIVTDVRVQRLGDMSEDDAVAEGIYQPGGVSFGWTHDAAQPDWWIDPVFAFRKLWNTLHTDPGTRWEDNPWIYGVIFDVRRGNIDNLEGAN